MSFDLELVRRYGCLTRTFDPSEAFRDRALAQADGDPRFTFLAVAVSPEDGPLKMYEGEDPSVDYHSAANLYGTKPVAEFPGRTIPSLMEEYGDERVDLLKLDVEGLEYEVLRDLDLAELGVRVFCAELHHTASARDAHDLLDDLADQGFRLVHHRRPANLSFLRARLVLLAPAWRASRPPSCREPASPRTSSPPPWPRSCPRRRSPTSPSPGCGASCRSRCCRSPCP